MDSPCIKQTVRKVLKIVQHGKYLVAYVLNNRRTRIKIAGNSVFDRHLSSVGQQMTIENSVSDDFFLSTFAAYDS